MSKKKRTHPQTKSKHSKPPRSKLSRFWHKRERSVKRILLWGLPIAAVIVAAIFLLSYFSGRSRAEEREHYLHLARQQLLRSNMEEALLSYHRAANADPDNKQVAREAAMANAKASLLRGGSLDNAIAAATSVIAYDSTSAVAHATLAGLYNREGDIPGLIKHAHAALDAAEAEADTVSGIAAAVYLGYGFRQKDMYDSAYQYGITASDWAQSTNDTFDLSLTRSSLGFALLGLDSLERARELFTKLQSLSGSEFQPFYDLSQLGLADCFEREGEYDSCMVYASFVETAYRTQPSNPNFAYASQLIGRAKAGEGTYDEAVIWLTESTEAWRAVAGYSPLVDSFNDLAEVYLKLKDYAQARKFYLAASKVAQAYAVPQKSKLTVDINNLLLDRLSSEQYVTATNEGEELAEQIIADMGFVP